MPQTQRFATIIYDFEYEYDQGGNRTKKTDLTNSPAKIEVEYEYDVHPPEPPEPNPYTTFNNRLMKYKTYSVTPGQPEMGVLGGGFETLGEGFETLGKGFETLGGGFLPPGELRILQSTTYYYYNDSGNVTRVLTHPNFTQDYSAVRLSYAYNERTVAFALGETWTWDGVNPPGDYHVTWAREFRYDGARQRYLNRVLDPLELEQGNNLVEVSSVWSDYAGDAIHGDFAFSGGSFTELTSYEPGLAKNRGQSLICHGRGTFVGEPLTPRDGVDKEGSRALDPAASDKHVRF